MRLSVADGSIGVVLLPPTAVVLSPDPFAVQHKVGFGTPDSRRHSVPGLDQPPHVARGCPTSPHSAPTTGLTSFPNRA
jgi:hypothetical protein